MVKIILDKKDNIKSLLSEEDYICRNTRITNNYNIVTRKLVRYSEIAEIRNNKVPKNDILLTLLPKNKYTQKYKYVYLKGDLKPLTYDKLIKAVGINDIKNYKREFYTNDNNNNVTIFDLYNKPVVKVNDKNLIYIIIRELWYKSILQGNEQRYLLVLCNSFFKRFEELPCSTYTPYKNGNTLNLNRCEQNSLLTYISENYKPTIEDNIYGYNSFNNTIAYIFLKGLRLIEQQQSKLKNVNELENYLIKELHLKEV